MTATVRAWLATRDERERRLVTLALVLTVAALGANLVAVVRDDLATLRARVAAHERELAQVRRLAATVTATRGEPGDDVALSTHLQAAADAAGLADRVAAMSPAATTGDAPARLSLRVGGATLAETVQLLHGLGREAGGLGIARFGLRKHPDDTRRFDVTLEVTGGRAP